MKIILCDPVDERINQHFESAEEFTVIEAFDRGELETEIDDTNFLVVRSGTEVDRELFDQAPELVGIVRAGVGLDNIDLEYAAEKNVRVENTPEASTNAVAELVVGHILAIYRSIPRADGEMKKGNWIKGELEGREIMDKTVGIVGFGRIGRRVGKYLSGFGAKILAFDEYISEEEIKSAGARPVTFDEIVNKSDIVTVHVPVNPETEDMFSKDEFKQMKDSAIIVNCSRGGIVSEQEIVEALDAGEIAGAGVDTYVEEPPGDIPFTAHQKVVATPHLGATTSEAQERIASLVIEKIETMAD